MTAIANQMYLCRKGMLVLQLLRRRNPESQPADLVFESPGGTAYYRGVEPQPTRQQKVMFGPWCCLHLPVAAILAVCLLPAMLCRAGERQPFNLHAPDIDLVHLTIDECQRSLHRIGRHTNLARPLIGRPAGNNAYNTSLPIRVHHSIDHLAQRPIAPV